MRKQLSTLALGILSGLAVGQGNVVVQVLSPASIANSYTNAYAVAASGWGVADLTLPENSVTGELVFAFDGTAADSLGCESITNAAGVAGKIAVIYRGECTFGQKALNAQEAGAIGVLLISNGDDLAINMQGGDFGPQVTVPVAMIGQSNGALIRPVIETEAVTALIGNNFGLFPNNLSIDEFDILVPKATAYPQALTANPGELSVTMGGFVHNFGNADQGPVRLRAIVSQNGSDVYDEVAEITSLAAGDSAFLSLPDFTQPSFSGDYTLTYSVESDVEDEFMQDNTYEVPLHFGDLLSYVPVNTAENKPIAPISVVPSDFEGPFRTCIAFTDQNASRMSVAGIYFAGRTPTDLSDPIDSALTGMLVTTYAFLWTDVVSGPFTVPTDGGLTTIDNGSYAYTDNLQGEAVYIPFLEPIQLDNGQRYLFCAETSESYFRHGWNEDVDYALNGDYSIEPTSIIRDGASWFNGFTGLGGSPALGVKMVETATIGIDELDRVELTPFPNPAQDQLRIPMKGFDGAAMLRIFNTTGAVVSEQKVAVGGNETMVVDLTNVANGTYLFHVDFENGKRSDFRVVVTK